ncbi:hypothetical protein BM221_009566 [Beauveria bassiana]|uniref:Uncharacterized protein n=1 Tax=Beauveria bassiana TaxID=176275 RepID=A0A2N6NBQ9_BEABA|nr:hypothetical protein BM221_009566 [Beauveria bassiana]
MDDSDPESVYKSADAAAASAAAGAPASTNANAKAGADDHDDADAPGSSGSSSSRGQKATPAALTTTGDMEHMWEQLELEKSRYPGASTWAPDEERLFELLFFRQDLPILPSHWELDMSAVPISEANFADVENAPVVYAHSTDFRATTALVRLIELTAAIRTTSESGLHHRVPGMIKDGLDRFLAWAAEDGGYSHLRVVPNIITEIVDTKMLEGDITALLQARMRALARLQRDNDNSAEDELARAPLAPTAADHSGAAPRRRRPFAAIPAMELDELAQPGDSVTGLLSSSASERDGLFSSAASTTSLVSSPSPATIIRYRRPPPVVYGFFILNSSVFILTADASRGDNAYVSFHVETDFLDQRQSVWNALTLAIVTCLARDDMRRRTEDFEPLAAEEDSDPDL